MGKIKKAQELIDEVEEYENTLKEEGFKTIERLKKEELKYGKIRK